MTVVAFLGDEVVWVQEYKVNITLILDGEPLTDNEVNAAQALLRANYPDIGGLQETLLGNVCAKLSR